MNEYDTALTHDKGDKEYIALMYAKADEMARDWWDNLNAWTGRWVVRWNRAVDALGTPAEAIMNWYAVRDHDLIRKHHEQFKGLYPDSDMKSDSMKRHIYPENPWGLAGLLEDLKQEPNQVICDAIKSMWEYKEWESRTADFIMLAESDDAVTGRKLLRVHTMDANYTMFLMLAVMEDVVKRKEET